MMKHKIGEIKVGNDLEKHVFSFDYDWVRHTANQNEKIDDQDDSDDLNEDLVIQDCSIYDFVKPLRDYFDK